MEPEIDSMIACNRVIKRAWQLDAADVTAILKTIMDCYSVRYYGNDGATWNT